MKHIGVIRNSDKIDSGQISDRIREYMESNGIECIFADDGSDLPETCEFAIVLGGDGTLLRASKAVNSKQIPLLGVNLGTLGYLAEVEIGNLIPALDKLIAGNYTVEERMMVYGIVYHDGQKIFSDIALNDIVISRQKALRTLSFHTYVNAEYLNTYHSDGVIVSTATGSTGYSLSVGGPIVAPSAEIVLMTPVAPHSLISRSIILSGSDRVRVEIGQGKTGLEQDVAMVSFDGNKGMMLATGDSVEIRRSKTQARIIIINHISFLEVLRRKMTES